MQRALTAARIALAAILFAGANDQSVEFIIQRCVRWQAGFEQLADLFIHELRQSHESNIFHRARRQELCTAKISDRDLNVSPRGILREDSANDNFEACAPRPPMLRPMRGK